MSLTNALTNSEMIADTLLAIYRTCEEQGILLWVDGGWGIDALLGVQTRPHKDADIVIQQKDLQFFCKYLEECGYKDIPQDDTHPWNFVLGAENGNLIDIHVIVFDKEGNGVYGPQENGQLYTTEALSGTGSINSYPIRCISPEWQVEFHTGYPLQDKDLKDVNALCQKFAIDLPFEYKRFKK